MSLYVKHLVRRGMSVTEFGFEWGPLTVERCCSFPTHHVLQVKTVAGRSIDICVSNAGRNIRVYDTYKPGLTDREWKPPVRALREEQWHCEHRGVAQVVEQRNAGPYCGECGSVIERVPMLCERPDEEAAS